MNALTSEDAALFEMKAYTGMEEAGHTPAFRIMIDDQYQCEFCYPNSIDMIRMPKWKQRFHRYKCYVITFVIVIGLVGAIAVVMFKGSTSTAS